MNDQAAGLRAWASPDALPLGVIGEPGYDALMKVVAGLPTLAERAWLPIGEAEARRRAASAWLLWADIAQLDVAELYRRLKVSVGPGSLPLLWIHDTRQGGSVAERDASRREARSQPAERLLDNLAVSARRFLGVELTRDAERWRSRLIECGRASG
ncbi:hypothetical protein [Salinicola rhizosphaerae]|uniref:Uncharacterized protein n=1 Tax=Salinicola rhizosphaerae TaxID=1443141 RepID=A0ABQ3DX18_9GAMM|nr:hypothetical protein [Salinicola rhizosphaerae]GHB16608.1 hypothetical protein GCM10009038_13980 [Salinicola rhizosphaerae]